MNAPLDASESPAAGVTVRRYEPRDRAAALALIKRESAIDDPASRILISDDGEGVALWIEPAAGNTAHLWLVRTKTPNRRFFYQLIRAACIDAMASGFDEAEFIVGDRRTVSMIRRDFTAPIEIYGRNGDTQEPTSWMVHVVLADVLPQLDAKIA